MIRIVLHAAKIRVRVQKFTFFRFRVESFHPATTTLQAASDGGNEKIVELLSKGADVNAQGGHFGNALQAASDGGHEKIVELLLGQGAKEFS